MLSPRVVVFTPNEVYYSSLSFDCREAYEFEETVYDGKYISRKRAKVTKQERKMSNLLWSPRDTLGYEWYKHFREEVMSYSGRRLSFQGDRLDAFSGVLSLFSILGHSQSFEFRPTGGLLTESQQSLQALNGLFPYENRFRESLLWRPIDGPLRAASRIRYNCTGTRALPSWSWAGWVVAVTMSYFAVSDTYVEPVVMDHVNVKVDTDVFRTSRKDTDWSRSIGPRWWPFKPQPCQVNSRDACVLHLFTHLFQGELRPVSMISALPASEGPEDHVGTTYSCDVFFVLPTGAKIRVGVIDVDGEYLINNESTIVEFVLISRGPSIHLPTKTIDFMVVQRWAQDNEFVERIGLLRIGRDRTTADTDVTVGGGPWNDLQKVIDDLSKRQHVRIV